LTGKLAVDACQKLAPGNVLEPGPYLLHSELRGFAHCVLLQAAEGDVSTNKQSLTIYDVRHNSGDAPECTKPLISTDNFCKAIDSAADKRLAVLFALKVVDDPASTAGLQELQAGGRGQEDGNEESGKDVRPRLMFGPELDDGEGLDSTDHVEHEGVKERLDNVEGLLDDVSHDCDMAASSTCEPAPLPSFPDVLTDRLREEVVGHMLDVGKRRLREACCCDLCPFRAFNRSEQLQTHMQYHKAPSYTAPDDSQSQFEVVKSLFRFDLVCGVCQPKGPPRTNYLRRSAAIIREWNADAPPAALKQAAKSNMPYMVLVLTTGGPQFWLRAKTVGSIRATDRVYYTRGFENLLVGLALVSHGKCSGVVDRLYQKWSEDGISPFLLSHGKSFIPVILRQVFTDTDGIAQRQRRQLMAEAVARGEFTALTHDASYKFLFSVVGQEKMAQQSGEIHAGHTLMGLTGACPGFSLQSTEGEDCFGAAVEDRLSPAAVQQVRLLYSDAPSEGMLDYLPNCLGAAEDRIHLVIRAEYCTGGKRTACSRALLKLQSKFAVPLGVPEETLLSEIYHGRPLPTISWESTPTPPARTDEGWQAFYNLPWRDHQEYVSELKRVVADYSHVMDRKNKKKMTLRKVLQNGAQPRHYHYLRNNNVFAQMSGVSNMLNGTPQNEAEHMTLKRWCHCVWQQHADRPVMISEVFGLARMLTNAVRNQSLGLTSLPAGRITHILGGLASAGALRIVDGDVACPPIGQRLGEECLVGTDAQDKRSILRKSLVTEGASAKLKRLAIRRARQQAWAKHGSKRLSQTAPKRKSERRNPAQIRANVEKVVKQCHAQADR